MTDHTLTFIEAQISQHERDLPAENAQHQVEHKERPHHNEGNKKDPVEGASDGVVGLENSIIVHFPSSSSGMPYNLCNITKEPKKIKRTLQDFHLKRQWCFFSWLYIYTTRRLQSLC